MENKNTNWSQSVTAVVIRDGKVLWSFRMREMGHCAVGSEEKRNRT